MTHLVGEGGLYIVALIFLVVISRLPEGLMPWVGWFGIAIATVALVTSLTRTVGRWRRADTSKTKRLERTDAIA